MNTCVGSYEWMLGAKAALKLMQDRDAEAEVRKRAEEASTGICGDCDGYGFHQFCGGISCERCGGTGNARTS